MGKIACLIFDFELCLCSGGLWMMDNYGNLNIGITTAFTENTYFGNLIFNIHNELKGHNTYVFNIWRLIKSSTYGYKNISSNVIDGWIGLPLWEGQELIKYINIHDKPLVMINSKIDVEMQLLLYQIIKKCICCNRAFD